VITNENRVRRNGTDFAMYYASGVPSSADYAVEGDVHVKSILAADAVGIIGRSSTSADTYYLARHVTSGTDRWELAKSVSGTITSLGTYDQTLSAGSTSTLRLEMQGSTIRLLVNGVQRVSVTDTSIAAAGRGGTRLGFSGATDVPTNTAGLHLDDFRVTSLSTTAADSMGTNPGTYSGGVRRNQTGVLSGDSNRAALFDGTSGRVDVTNKTALQLTGSFSIEGWVKPNVLTGDRYVLGKGGLYYLYFSGTDVVFGYRSGGAYQYILVPGGVSTGSWQHFVGTYNGNTVSLYRNGVEVWSEGRSGAVDSDTSNLFIGAYGTGGFFNGQIDEVALYNSALSAATVLDHYRAGTGTG
jgi:hypothetical protein